MFSRMEPIRQEQIVLSLTVLLIGVLPALQPNGEVVQYQGIVAIVDPLQSRDRSLVLTDASPNWDPTRSYPFPEGIAKALYRQLELKPIHERSTVTRTLPPPLKITCHGDLTAQLHTPVDELSEWIASNCASGRL